MTSITTLCKQYLEVFPQEEQELRPLLDQLERKGEEGIGSSKTFDTGHLTAAAIVVALPSRRVLLLEHTFYKKLLQPGGHVEAEDASVLATAYRECEEEVGIPASAITYIPLTKQNRDLPFNISVYQIPGKPDKNEPPHHHYDFLYLFTVKDDEVVTLDGEEATNHIWMPFADFALLPDFVQQAKKVEVLLTDA